MNKNILFCNVFNFTQCVQDIFLAIKYVPCWISIYPASAYTQGGKMLVCAGDHKREFNPRTLFTYDFTSGDSISFNSRLSFVF